MSEQPLHPPAPKLLARVSAALRTRHRSRRTEEAYVGWIRRFILFHRKRVKDVDLERRQIVLRRGKGQKDGITVLAESVRPRLVDHRALDRNAFVTSYPLTGVDGGVVKRLH